MYLVSCIASTVLSGTEVRLDVGAEDPNCVSNEPSEMTERNESDVEIERSLDDGLISCSARRFIFRLSVLGSVTLRWGTELSGGVSQDFVTTSVHVDFPSRRCFARTQSRSNRSIIVEYSPWPLVLEVGV